jgi:2-succinyl-6-hydroxy-2,4-cyclohexadiene-1-carboxylate synthase
MRVVLLHGFTQGPRSWDGLAERLAGRHELVTPTLPGHGGAGAIQGTFEEEAAALAEAVGPPPAAWVGYSMGGRLALRVALDRPDLVQGLVLLGATAGLNDPAEREARRRVDETLASGLERQGLDRFLTGWLNQALFKRLPPEAAGLEERRTNTVAGLASALRRLGTGSQEPVWDRLHELHMPVLLMAGEHDATFVSVAFRLTAGIGEGAGMSIVPGAGHAAHLERPEAFATILERFLDRQPPHASLPSSSSSNGAP